LSAAQPHFDNSPRNKFARDPDKDVFGGEQSWEEMDAPWIGLVLDRNVDPKTVYTENPDAISSAGLGAW
jgi:hypothetical protein